MHTRAHPTLIARALLIHWAMPGLPFVPPMLARLVRTMPDGPDWEYELKLDGYRLQVIKDGEKWVPS